MSEMPPNTAPAAMTAAASGCSRWLRLRRRSYELLARAGGNDAPSLLVDGFLIALISLSVLAIILESVESVYRSYRAELLAFEIFTIAVFTAEYIVRAWSAVEASPGQAPWRTRLRYLCSASAIIDLLAILPFYLVTAGVLGGGDMRYLRAVRLLRVLKLTRYSAAFDVLIKAFTENARAFVAALSVLLIVMLLAATGMYFFEREAQPEEFASIPAAMWWAFATLTTVGYGDVTPVTTGGKMFGAMITVVGVGMVALPTGILASAYTEQLRVRGDAYRQQSGHALADGILTQDEIDELERLRESLGLGRATASQILNSEQVRAALEAEKAHCCPHCGAPAR